MKKFVFGSIAIVVIVVIALGVAFRGRIQRVRMAASLFSGAEQYQYFGRVPDFFPHSEVPASGTPWRFESGETIELPDAFVYKGAPVDTETFLTETDTSALLVLQAGKIKFERYMLTGARDVRWLSMSVAKSFISALVGIAVSEGQIETIEDPITKYVPQLTGSAYDGVRIKDILQMSSGARWNEDYSDSNSDINRFGRIFATGGSLNEFASTLTSEREPGTVNHYNSIDTQVLGMLIVAATGKSITEYMTEKLWQPMGAEYSAFWLVDSDHMEMAFGGFNATALDYAKLGELYRRGGNLHGQQIVPADWVKSSVTPDAPHLHPKTENPESEFGLGYGYQWWIPAGSDGEYSAIGVYNQFIYVNPAHEVVIVKLSANSDYGTTDDESSYREMETIEMFRAIVNGTEPETQPDPTPSEEVESSQTEEPAPAS